MERRDFLRLVGGAAAAATTLPAFACGGSGDKPKPSAAGKGKAERPVLRIASVVHFVPAFDAWFDNEYTRRWGEENDITVVIDHIPIAQLAARAEAERTAGAGHDLFAYFQSGPAAFEDDVVDHGDIVEEVRAKLGPVTPLAERSAYNPKTGRWFAFPQSWVPGPVHYRTDQWAATGRKPDTWEDILAAAPTLKRAGHPLGISLSAEPDGNFGLMGMLASFGAAIQDEAANLTLNRPATVEAVKVATELFRSGMTDEVLTWDGSSNNRYLASGTGSLIVNAVSALRAVEDQDPELAAKIALQPPPAGPGGRLGTYATGGWAIWRFAKNRQAAERFLVDLALNGREQFVRSRLYDLPPFPAAAPDLHELLMADPSGKYGLLAEAGSWTTNFGHPGTLNAAIDEVRESYLIPRMFAAAARGEKGPEQAVADAAAEAQPVFDKWRERGKI